MHAPPTGSLRPIYTHAEQLLRFSRFERRLLVQVRSSMAATLWAAMCDTLVAGFLLTLLEAAFSFYYRGHEPDAPAPRALPEWSSMLLALAAGLTCALTLAGFKLAQQFFGYQ